jgi:tagaturonate epimerase
MLELGRYSMGTGDRFAHQGEAQLAAFAKARSLGVDVAIVWNKSRREHSLTGTVPTDVRREADAAVAALGWQGDYHVDADHVGFETVDAFIAACDFFTLDVADQIGKPASADAMAGFVDRHRAAAAAAGIGPRELRATAEKYLAAAQEAGRIYRKIEAAKGPGRFITEVSMDETAEPQGPDELFLILAALADEGIPVQTIAPKFTGQFHKGVDYVGDVGAFEKEFEEDVGALALAVQEFGLPANLKLSVHSGSDKFSLYPGIHRVMHQHGVGVHLKTAGTTWLEEVVGLCEAGGDGLVLAKDLYAAARGRVDELCRPYATVVDMDPAALPEVTDVAGWSSRDFVEALRHDPDCPRYDRNLRQLLHVAFKVAAEMGDRYRAALQEHRAVVARNVTLNLFERHLRPVFIG